MTNPITNVNVNVIQAPTPSTLQRTGAFISQGATNTSPGTKSLLTQLSDLTPILTGAAAITSISWSGGVATVMTTSPHGLTGSLPVTIAGASPSGYNGTFYATVTGASTFTYPLATNPGSETVPGVFTVEDVAELVAMATTFFAQGGQQGVYVLELGEGNATEGVAFLTAWITANPGVFYSYLVPRFWDGNAAFLTMLGQFNNTTSKTYFFVTTTLQNYGLYTAVMKCCFALVECPTYGVWPANVITALSQTGGVATATTTTNHGVVPGDYFQLSGNTPAAYDGWFLALAGTATDSLVFNVPTATGAESALGTLVQSQYASGGIPATEFSLASVFFNALGYKPSSANPVAPLELAYLYAVTPFPTQGNAAILELLNAADISIVDTGAQGGLSDLILIGGNMKDGNPFTFWYSVDWVQITVPQAITAALIAARNSTNPIYFNQPGINAVQQITVTTMNNGITYGLVLNTVKLTQLDAEDFAEALDADTFAGYTVVNADPFSSYVTENPDDYKAGTYDGLSIDYAPLIGFQSITVNISVSQFAT
jgi:hypothetical protein